MKKDKNERIQTLFRAIQALRESNLTEEAKRRGIVPLQQAVNRIMKER